MQDSHCCNCKKPDGCIGHLPSLQVLSPIDASTVIVATTKTDSVIIDGKVGDNQVQMMLDSESSVVSILRLDLISAKSNIHRFQGCHSCT